MRAAASAVVPGSVVSSHHSMAGVPPGGTISRANTTVSGGAAGVVAGRWTGRAISTTVVRHSNLASRSGWPVLGIVTFMVPRTGLPQCGKPIINIRFPVAHQDDFRAVRHASSHLGLDLDRAIAFFLFNRSRLTACALP